MQRFFQLIVLSLVISCLCFSVYGAEVNTNSTTDVDTVNSGFKPLPYSSQCDMAFMSVWGSKPDAKKLQGFQRAVLFNARGEVVRRVEIRSDSIFSLDKMIQENKEKGPLFIKMYRK